MCSARCYQAHGLLEHSHDIHPLSSMNRDMFEALERFVDRYDWDRGTMHRASRVLSGIHQLRQSGSVRPPSMGETDTVSGTYPRVSERDYQTLVPPPNVASGDKFGA